MLKDDIVKIIDWLQSAPIGTTVPNVAFIKMASVVTNTCLPYKYPISNYITHDHASFGQSSYWERHTQVVANGTEETIWVRTG